MYTLRILLTGILALWLSMAGAQVQAQVQGLVAVPPLSAHVIDQAGMLDVKQRNNLDQVLKEYETRSGSQIAILLVNSTAPEAIEQYSIRVADAWKLGRKGIDDGVILVVAKDNDKALRRLRIEAGRGIQGTVTDAQSKRILQDVIAPYFRQNDYHGGLAAAITALTTLMDQEHLPAPTGKSTQQATDDGLSGWLPILFLLFMFSAIIYRRSRSSFKYGAKGRNAGVILGSAGLGGLLGGGFGRHSGGGSGGGGGGFGGGGGGFDGGGASGDW